MNQQELRPRSVVNSSETEGFKIDYKRVLYRCLRYWYVIVISLLVALAIAFVKNRYAPRVYSVFASIIIKEAEQTTGAELLYSNALVDPYRNYLNELYIIRSFPLIRRVLEDLNFGPAFYREGNILTSELYHFPVKATILNTDQTKGCRFVFRVLNETQYQLAPDIANQPQVPAIFNFNDTISFQGVSAIFKLRDKAGIHEYVDNNLIFSYTAPEYLVGHYISNLGADWAEEGSGVMNLSINGLNPNKEIDFINGLIKQYQNYDLHNKNQMGIRTIEFINSQLVEISDSLENVENILERFKGKNIVTDLGQETNRLYGLTETVELQRTEMLVRQNYYQYLIDYIQQDQNLDQVILPTSVGIADPVLAQAVSEMISIQLDMKMVVNQERLDNPLIRQKRERLQEIKRNIIESVKNQQQTDQIRQDALTKRIKKLEQEMSHLPQAEREYVSIRRNYSLLENLYIFLLQKRAEASISQASNISDIVIVNPPMSGGTISPQPVRNYVIAGLIGLALPLLFFAGLELSNTRIQSKEDIEKLTSIPFIGGVGHKTSGDNRTVLTSPKSAVSESFRALRSNLNYFLKGKDNVVILITSSISGEGKTFTTINLATVLAYSGKKTIIVGADMRRPKLFDDFSLTNDLGLSSYLVGFNTFEEVVQSTGVENLDMVSGGPVPPNPSELIMGERMSEFIRIARQKYDYVIVDSPPLAIVADAFVLTEHADHMVYLSRQNYTPKNMLRSLDDYYQSGRLKNISILLNDIYKSGPGYGYGYGYDYGYGYSQNKNGYGYYSES